MTRFLLAASGLLFSASGLAQDPSSSQDVLDCMRGNVVERGGVRHLQVTTIDADHSSTTLELDFFWRPSDGGTAVSLHVTQPKSLAGAAYLLRENAHGDDELFVYVPTIGKARKIIGVARGERLWGTGLSYEEIKLVQGLVLTGVTKRRPDSTFAGRAVYVLESQFGTSADAPRKAISYVDRKSCTVLRSELFNPSGTVAKILEGDLAMLFETTDHADKPIWMMLGYTMKDLDHQIMSVVRLGEIHLLERARGGLFSPETFYRPELEDDR